MKKNILIKMALSEGLLANAGNKAFAKFKNNGDPKKAKQFLTFMNAGGINSALRPKKKAITVQK